MNDTHLISKKELLERYGISYGALYRWKRKGLIPDAWFIKTATATGQETFFPAKLICERVETILAKKEDILLDELAKECHLSVTSFRRLFCEIYHQSPISYLLELRIRKAKELLLLGLSLEEAALSTGFSSTNYFIRYFGRKTGVTPKAFQQENMK